MRREIVDDYLKNYKEYSARCRHLECSIAETGRMIAEAKQSLVEDSVHITQRLSGMPPDGGAGDPTGQLGIRIASGFLPGYIVELEQDIKEMMAELRQKAIVVQFVEAWLEVLNPKERFIIKNQTIGGMFWREISHSYSEAYGCIYSKDGLRRIRDTALEKMYKIAERVERRSLA